MANYSSGNPQNDRQGSRRTAVTNREGDRQNRPSQSRDDRMRRPSAYIPRDSAGSPRQGSRNPSKSVRRKNTRQNASRIAILVLSCVAIILMIVICCVALSGGFSRNTGAAETTTSPQSAEGTVNGGTPGTEPDKDTSPANTSDSAAQTTPVTTPVTSPAGSETEFVSHPSEPHEGAKIIVIDAGHGFADGGSTSDLIQPLNEMDINMLIAQKLKTKLQAAGHTVIMTHESNEIPAGKPGGYLFNKYDRRIFLEEQQYADFFISIHCNSYTGSGTARGTRIYYCTENSQLTPGYADKLSAGIYGVLSSKEPRIYPQETADAFVVLQTRKCPAFLIEVGFITDAQDAANMITDAWQEQMATGISTGIRNCLGN